jgi:hypothetical protein
MAKAAKKLSKKRTAPARQVSQKKESRPKKQSRTQKSSAPQAESWLSAASTLVTSQVGRTILAEVLEAAASALRKDRGRDADEPRSGSPSIASDLSAEGASSVFARTAAGVLAEVATGAVRRMLPEVPKDDGDGDTREP